MTISSLAKFIAGVNRMVVENVEIENPENNPTLIISVRPRDRRRNVIADISGNIWTVCLGGERAERLRCRLVTDAALSKAELLI